tara:strand:- start:962 stop:1177 length:216 start_codon:yes stop_codon:yes gene_type:complete
LIVFNVREENLAILIVTFVHVPTMATLAFADLVRVLVVKFAVTQKVISFPQAVLMVLHLVPVAMLYRPDVN